MTGTLRSDQRGAMMVIGLFFAIFGVAILYSAIGVSQAALFRQHMQDGADASALSGAVMQARSMNLIVLLNIVMAALLSVLVALKLVEAIAIAGIFIAGTVATPTYGGSLALVPPLETIRDKVKTIHDELEEPISEALKALHDLADLVADVAPAAASAVAEGTRQHPVDEVFVGVGAKLPVEDDEFRRLCEEAGSFPIELARETLPLPKGGVLDKLVTEPLAGAMEKLASTFSEWFCGDSGDGDSPPSESITQLVWVPGDPGSEVCGAPPIDQDEDLDRDQIEVLTNEYANDCSAEVTRAYAEGCDEHGPCRLSDAIAVQAENARVACQSGGGFTDYAYQWRSGTVTYTWNGRGWERGTPTMEPPEFENEQLLIPPCGPKGGISESYNITVHEDDASDVVTPLCSSESLPEMNGRRPVGDEEHVSFTEIIHMMGCAKEQAVPVEIDSEQSEGGEEKSPKRVTAELEQGSEEFQVRAVAVGSPSYSAAEAAVRLSLWGHEAGDTSLEEIRAHGGFSVAQAEFLYDEDDDRDAWMWNMKWRARITRFRATAEQLAPVYEDCATTQDAVADAIGVEDVVEQSDCTTFLDELVRMDRLVTH